MVDPFIGEIKMFSFSWAPTGWAFCNGASLVIQQNAALYSLLGIQFGGNATNFNLPDLRGRTPVASGQNYNTGNNAGQEGVVLTTTSIPAHTHTLYGSSSPGNKATPLAANDIFAVPTVNLYAPSTSPVVPLNANAVAGSGTSAPHNNMQPSTVTNFCIALSGVYPSRN